MKKWVHEIVYTCTRMNQHMIFWHVSQRRVAQTQTGLRKCAVSAEPCLPGVGGGAGVGSLIFSYISRLGSFYGDQNIVF